MAEDGVLVNQICGKCGNQTGSFSVKKENMMLSSIQLLWCRDCKQETPEIRETAGRRESVDEEQRSYPSSLDEWYASQAGAGAMNSGAVNLIGGSHDTRGVILTNMIVAIGLAEAIGIYALVAAAVLIFGN